MSDDRETFVPAVDREFVIPTWLIEANRQANELERQWLARQFTVNDDGSITIHRQRPTEEPK